MEKVELKIYKVAVVCDNCGGEGTVEIPKGILKGEFLRKTECPDCGCYLSKEITWCCAGTVTF